MNVEQPILDNGRRRRAPGTVPAAAALQPRAEWIVLAACIVAGLVPVWSVTRFPSVDGPIHLYIMFLIETLSTPGDTVFARLFEFNRYIEPNYGVYAILWLLDRVFPLPLAEKIYVSLYWIAFALAGRYLMRSFGADRAIYAFLLLPFAFGFFLHYGFYNFTLSQVLFLVAAGYALRHVAQLQWMHIAVLSLLMLALGLTHLVGSAMFLLFVGLARVGVAVQQGLAAPRGDAIRSALMRLVLDALRLLLAAAPTLAIMASFYLRHVIADDSSAPQLTLIKKIFYVGSLGPIFSVDRREAIVFAPFVALFWALMIKLALDLFRDRAKLLAALPTLLPTAALFAVIAIGSLTFAAFDALPRLLPFLFFMMIITLGAVALNRIWRAAILGAVAFGLVGSAVIHVDAYRQFDNLYESYASARSAPQPGSIAVALNMAAKQHEIDGKSTGWRMNMTGHFRETYAREHRVALANIELLSPSIFGYFPVHYRDHVSLAAAMSDDRFAQGSRALSTFEQQAGLPITYVEIWPRREMWQHQQWLSMPRNQQILAELERDWRPVTPNADLAPLFYVKPEVVRP